MVVEYHRDDYPEQLIMWVKHDEFLHFPEQANEQGKTPEEFVNIILDEELELFDEYIGKLNALHEEIFGVPYGEPYEFEDEDEAEWAEEDFEFRSLEISPGWLPMFVGWYDIANEELKRRGWTNDVEEYYRKQREEEAEAETE